MNERHSCCTEEKNPQLSNKQSKSCLMGLLYGFLPHCGCLAFIIGSIFGVTFLTQLTKPLLANKYFFPGLIILSLTLATLSSLLYLKKQNLLSVGGARQKWKYLTLMYGATVGVNLLFFMFIFPWLAGFPTLDTLTANSPTPINALSSLTLNVNIPCSGHVPLISDELKTIKGVNSVKFIPANSFEVKYDSSKTNPQEITSLAIFKEYPATITQ